MTFPISKHRLWQVAVDAALIAAAWYLAFQLRFDKGIPIYYQTLFDRSIAIVIGIQLVTFVAFGFYNRWWRYVSTRDMWGAARGVTAACVISSLVVYFAKLVSHVDLPRSVAIKFLKPMLSKNLQAVRRFKREARLAAALNSLRATD